MTVSKLIQLLQTCDPNKTVKLSNGHNIADVQELFFDNEVILYTAEQEQETSEEEFDSVEYEEYFANLGEVLDSAKINGVG